VLPLEGVRVTDLSWLVPGGWGTRQLAGFGAQVIRVEWKTSLDPIRYRNTFPVAVDDEPAAAGERGRSPNRSGMFNNTNAGKLSVGLNIKHPRGQAILRDLIAASDVVVENFTADTLRSWGFGYDALKAMRPDIIYVQLPGYGTYGPYVNYRAYGQINHAFTGLAYQSGLPQPVQPCGWGSGFMSPMAGLYNASAVIAALHYRNRTGKGQHIDLAQTELGIYLTGTAYLDKQVNGRNYQRTGNRSPYLPAAPHGVYRCAGEDEWIAIACFSDQEWQALCQAMGRPAWTDMERFMTLDDRSSHQDELDRQVEAFTRLHSKHQIMHLLQRAGVPAGAVQTAEEIVDYDPAMTSRDYLVWLNQTEAGLWPVERIPGSLSETPSDPGGLYGRGSPSFAEDTEFVLKSVLSLSDDELASLRGDGCIDYPGVA
jgi:crotonobetainyl-CoA:carnitine CoA-transferase CaiB-like acyl-CoA transferase